MAKYMAIASYTAAGMRGVTAKGGSARVEASRQIVAEAGGTLESFYFAFGKDDAYIVCDLPDNVAAASVAMAVADSGLVVTRMVTLLTPEEIDHAAARSLPFQAPGG